MLFPWKIWIVGHSFVFCGQLRAWKSAMGIQLGHLPPVDWLEMWGMKWKVAVTMPTGVSTCCLSHPQLIVLHLGENDIPRLSVVDLINAIVVEDFHYIELVLPGLTCCLAAQSCRNIWYIMRLHPRSTLYQSELVLNHLVCLPTPQSF